MKNLVRSHRDLAVHQTAMAAAIAVSKIVRSIPRNEFKLMDQARRSARSPGASIAEAWPRRRYKDHWISKLSDAQSEACEAQWWLEIILNEGYCTRDEFEHAFDLFEKLKAQLSNMIRAPDKWLLSK